MKPNTKVIWQKLHKCTTHSWAVWQTDWRTDTTSIGNNSLHLMHSMQPKILQQSKLKTYHHNCKLQNVKQKYEQDSSAGIK